MGRKSRLKRERKLNNNTPDASEHTSTNIQQLIANSRVKYSHDSYNSCGEKLVMYNCNICNNYSYDMLIDKIDNTNMMFFCWKCVYTPKYSHIAAKCETNGLAEQVRKSAHLSNINQGMVCCCICGDMMKLHTRISNVRVSILCDDCANIQQRMYGVQYAILTRCGL